jgi:ferric-dicitrate binding protein FerR (iron transport regulator)
MEESIDISLLDRFMKGETSDQENTQLLKWFRSEQSQKEIVAFYQKRWEEKSDSQMPLDIQERMFHQIKTRVDESGRKRKIHNHTFAYWLQYAAAIILLFAIGLGTHTFIKRPQSINKELLVTAEKGQRANVTLPDGTKVWINSHSQISYPTDYGENERRLSLNGEAYFEVAKDENKRFIVNAGEMEVEALGTSFNIKAYSEDETIITTLFSGKIKTTVANASTELLPNQFASYNRQSRKLTYMDAENVNYASMWRNNELAFNSQLLSEIATTLHRLYNVNIEFKSEKLRHYRFSGVIKNNSLENVIEIISLTAPIQYETNGDTIVLIERELP